YAARSVAVTDCPSPCASTERKPPKAGTVSAGGDCAPAGDAATASARAATVSPRAPPHARRQPRAPLLARRITQYSIRAIAPGRRYGGTRAGRPKRVSVPHVSRLTRPT